MPDRDARGVFDDSGAFLRGHFVYTSGRHGADYLEKFRILEDPQATTELASLIAERFKLLRPELVAGPTMGGIILAYDVARQLGIDAIYAERGPEGGRVLRRGFDVAPGTKVLVVDDVVTTGGSINEMVSCMNNAGGTVIGIGVLADRTGGRIALGIPFYACLTVDFPSYAPEECPLCATGVPIAAPRGSRIKPSAALSS